MQFDGALGLSEVGPGEHGQAQVDGGGVQGIDGVVEFQSQVVLGIQGPGDADEGVCEVGIQAPVALLVGVGRCGPCRRAVPGGRVCPGAREADLDVAQALAVGELGEGQAEELASRQVKDLT